MLLDIFFLHRMNVRSSVTEMPSLLGIFMVHNQFTDMLLAASNNIV